VVAGAPHQSHCLACLAHGAGRQLDQSNKREFRSVECRSWADRFQMDPVSNSVDHTLDEVRARPDILLTELIAYFDAVRAVARLPSQRHRHRPGPGITFLNLGNRHTRLIFEHILVEISEHVGQVELLRDMMRGVGAKDGRREQVWAFPTSLRQSN